MANNGFFGAQGQYIYDQAERTMINRIVKRCIGAKNGHSYEMAYDFLESDWGGWLYEKFYDHFKELNMDFVGPFNLKKTYFFERVLKSAYSHWISKNAFSEDKMLKFFRG